MTPDPRSDDAPPTESMPRHHPVTRTFHWVIALGVFVMLPVGIAMTHPFFGDVQDPLFTLHKGLGTLLLVLVLLRILWRLFHTPPPPPPTMSRVQRWLAGGTHAFLYVLLVTLTVSGYVRVVGGGFPIELLDRFGIPYLLPEMPVWADRMSMIHKFGGYLLAGAVAAHVAAAVHHAVVMKDGIFSRIWPPVGGGKG